MSESSLSLVVKSTSDFADELMEQVRNTDTEALNFAIADETARLEQVVDQLEKDIRDFRELGVGLTEEERAKYELPPGITEEDLRSSEADRLDEAQATLRSLLDTFTERAQKNIELMTDIIELKKQSALDVGRVFESLFKEGEDVKKEIDSFTEKEAQDQHAMLASKAKEAQRIKLDEIKRRSCLFFGCIDVHPPQLYNL